MGPDQRHYFTCSTRGHKSKSYGNYSNKKDICMLYFKSKELLSHTILEKYFFLAVRITYKIRKNNKQKDVKNKSLNTNLLEIQMVERIKFFFFFIK